MLKIQIDIDTPLGPDAWECELSTADWRVIDAVARPQVRQGTPNVFLLSEVVSTGTTITFAPSALTVSNRGSSPRAVIVRAPNAAVPSGVTSAAKPPRSGDDQFIADLPPALVDLGTSLLAAVRTQSAGDLESFPNGRYVETPDNFWTVKIQPRDVSLRITVRGNPELFGDSPTIDIKPDRNGYSTFKVARVDQVDEVLAILRRVRKR